MPVGKFVGVVIMSAFAVLWVAIGTRTLRRVWWIFLTIVSAAISATIAAGAWRLMNRDAVPYAAASTSHRFHLEFYWAAVAFEAVAIPIAVVALKRTRRYPYILPTITFLVGLHFLGLVPAFSSFAFAWLGGAICGLAVFTVGLLPSTIRNPSRDAKPLDLWALVVGTGCAVILWGFAIDLLC
jgi:hypothetical protein